MIFFFFTFLFARWKIEILRDEIYLFLCLFSIEFRVFFFGREKSRETEGLNCFRSKNWRFEIFVFIHESFGASIFEPAIKNSKTCGASENL